MSINLPLRREKVCDNSRTPMQWDSSTNAEFSTGIPWWKVGKSYQTINVETEKTGKIFPFYQELIKLRKDLPIIAEGDYTAAYADSDKVYVFERQLGDQKLLILNNFFAETVTLDLPEIYQSGQVLISNYDGVELGDQVTLQPYQTLAILVG